MYTISTYPLAGKKLLEFVQSLAESEVPRVGFELFYDNIPFYTDKAYSDWLDEYTRGGRLGMHCPMEGCCLLAPKDSLTYRYTVDKHTACFALAQKLGARYVVIHTNSLEPRTDAQRLAQRALLPERMAATATLAQKFGLRIAIENVGFAYNHSLVADQASFLALAENPAFDILFDLGHAHANGWDIPKLVEALNHKIVGFHFHDNDGSCDSHLPIGQGSISWDNVLAAIKRYAPNADFTIEYAKPYVSDIASGVRLLERRLAPRDGKDRL